MGNNIELLKQELIKQKNLIESRGGVVRVANNNPSPYEITEGIKTVQGSLDLKLATATPADVQSGKTFYAGTSELKTGTNSANALYNLRFFNDSSHELLNTPDDLPNLPPYLFAYTESSTKINLSTNVEKIGTHCFDSAKLGGFSFNNTSKLQNIESYAFTNSNININFSSLPDSLTTMGDRLFYGAPPTNDGYIKIPRNVSSVGQFAFSCNKACEVPDGINWNNNTAFNVIPQYGFYHQGIRGEFTVPSHIITVKNSAFYNALFTKFVVPNNVTTLEGNFYCVSPDFTNKIEHLDIIFESVTPPKFQSSPFYYLYLIPQDKFSIYVPDESIEAYKALSVMSSYVDYFKPMSQLPE